MRVDNSSKVSFIEPPTGEVVEELTEDAIRELVRGDVSLNEIFYPSYIYLNYDGFDLVDISGLSALRAPAIKEVDISGNRIVSLTALERFDAMKRLYASRNLVSRFTASFQTLVLLDLSNNELREFPEFSRGMPSLEILDLSHNSISGSWRNVVNKCPKLRTFFAHHNNINCAPLEYVDEAEALGRLKDLRQCALRDNPIEVNPGYRLWIVANCPKLSMFDGTPCTKAERKSSTQQWQLEVKELLKVAEENDSLEHSLREQSDELEAWKQRAASLQEVATSLDKERSELNSIIMSQSQISAYADSVADIVGGGGSGEGGSRHLDGQNPLPDITPKHVSISTSPIQNAEPSPAPHSVRIDDKNEFSFGAMPNVTDDINVTVTDDVPRGPLDAEGVNPVSDIVNALEQSQWELAEKGKEIADWMDQVDDAQTREAVTRATAEAQLKCVEDELEEKTDLLSKLQNRLIQCQLFFSFLNETLDVEVVPTFERQIEDWKKNILEMKANLVLASEREQEMADLKERWAEEAEKWRNETAEISRAASVTRKGEKEAQEELQELFEELVACRTEAERIQLKNEALTGWKLKAISMSGQMADLQAAQRECNQWKEEAKKLSDELLQRKTVEEDLKREVEFVKSEFTLWKGRNATATDATRQWKMKAQQFEEEMKQREARWERESVKLAESERELERWKGIAGNLAHSGEIIALHTPLKHTDVSLQSSTEPPTSSTPMDRIHWSTPYHHSGGDINGLSQPSSSTASNQRVGSLSG